MVRNNEEVVRLQHLSAEAERKYGQKLEEILGLCRAGFVSKQTADRLKAAAREHFKQEVETLYEEIRRLGAS